MSRPFIFSKLPEEMQHEIKARLLADGFCGYVELAEELRSRGCYISKSSLHRVAQLLRADVEFPRGQNYRISKSSLHLAAQLQRANAEFLSGWAQANPEQAAAMVSTLKVGGRVSLTVEVTA